MERFNERIAGASALLALLALGLDTAFRSYSALDVFAGLSPYLLFTALVGALVFVRLWLARRAMEEQQDARLAGPEAASGSLFSAAEDDALPLTRGQRQFERFFVALAAPLLALLQAAAAWRLYGLAAAPADPASHRLAAAAFLAGQAFVFFVFSRYLLGLAREPSRVLLRGPGLWMGWVALGSLLGAVSGIVGEAGYPRADRWLAWGLAGWLGVLAAEGLLNTLVALYRPRRANQGPAAVYESRLGRLFCEPAHLVSNAAQALDYQFGFKVSETWFYRFLENALLPLLILQGVLLYLLSCLVILGPEEAGVIERLGRPRSEAGGGWRLESGLHFKWPWPFETVRRFPVGRMQTVHIGYTEENPDGPLTELLWTKPHYRREDQFLVASRTARRDAGDPEAASVPVNLVSFNVPVEYRITNLFAYAYGFADPTRTLRDIAYRGLTREAVNRGLFDVLGEGQLEAARSLRERIQADVSRLGLGLEITFVGFQGIHPPVPIADAFEAVIGSIEERETAILGAKAYASRRLPTAEGEALRVEYAARAYRNGRIAVAGAEAEQFLKRREGYARSPGVFKSRYYLRALRDALEGTRLYVVAASPTSEVLQFNFEEKLPASLFDLSGGTE